MRLKVDIILVAGDRPILAARNATKTIPIVMMGAGLDPVEAGHIESLARPGGNVTGVTLLSRELGGKRLELLKEAVPKVAVRGSLRSVRSVQCTRGERGSPGGGALAAVDHSALGGTRHGRFRAGIAALSQRRPDGLYVAGSPLMNANQKRTIAFALKSRLPSVYSEQRL